MKAKLVSQIAVVDHSLSRWWVRALGERCGLLTFLFHGLFQDEREIALQQIDPQQRTTVQHFRQFIEHLLGHEYRFVSPDDILAGLDPARKHVLITFDDGYFNNYRALPLLREYRVPAAFYISTGHVQQNKCFWYDALYRLRTSAGRSLTEIHREGAQFKSMTNPEIEKLLGREALAPVSDLDRPFTPAELRDFARERFVFLGNHTREHAVLTNYPPEGVRAEIVGAQQAIQEMTGLTVNSIAYPNGDYSPQVIAIAREAGLKLGITCDHHKNPLPLDFTSDGAMRLGRFHIEGNDQVAGQCDFARSDLHLYERLRYRMVTRRVNSLSNT